MFEGTAFNGAISDWDTGNVVDMGDMFAGAANFNGDISDWDTGNVVDMGGMFKGAAQFNQLVGSWDTAKVTIMRDMFRNARSFNKPLPASFLSARVTDLSYMFACDATLDGVEECNFNQDIKDWDVSRVKNVEVPTTPYNTTSCMPHMTTPRCTTPHSTTPHHATPRHTIPYRLILTHPNSSLLILVLNPLGSGHVHGRCKV